MHHKKRHLARSVLLPVIPVLSITAALMANNSTTVGGGGRKKNDGEQQLAAVGVAAADTDDDEMIKRASDTSNKMMMTTVGDCSSCEWSESNGTNFPDDLGLLKRRQSQPYCRNNRKALK